MTTFSLVVDGPLITQPVVLALLTALEWGAISVARRNDAIPPQARWKADNYNHLMEQPTLFYAVAVTIAVAGAAASTIDVGLAWAYVALRVVHSLIQATVNVVEARFLVFAFGSLVLLALTVRAAILVF